MAITATAQELFSAVISEATASGVSIWTKIKTAATFYLRGFTQSLADIAASLAAGDISKVRAKEYARNAAVSLFMMIANVTQVVLFEIEKFLKTIFKTLKGLINKGIGISLL